MSDFAATLQAMREQLAAERARIDRALEAVSDLQKSYPVSGNGQPRATVPAKQGPKKTVPERGKASTKHLDGKRVGRPPTWDVVKGEQFWKTKPDMLIAEIADRVGTTAANLTERAKRCDWGPRPTKATGPTTTKKCRACGSTVTPGQACPACGIPT